MMLELVEGALVLDGSGELSPALVADLQAEGGVPLGDIVEGGDSSCGRHVGNAKLSDCNSRTDTPKAELEASDAKTSQSQPSALWLQMPAVFTAPRQPAFQLSMHPLQYVSVEWRLASFAPGTSQAGDGTFLTLKGSYNAPEQFLPNGPLLRLSFCSSFCRSVKRSNRLGAFLAFIEACSYHAILQSMNATVTADAIGWPIWRQIIQNADDQINGCITFMNICY